MIHYFAYGSNLHPLRLLERVASAELVGVCRYEAHRLAFDKQGRDGSGKCTLVNTGSEADVVYGALYTLDPVQKRDLDRFEGSGYCEHQITLQCHGQEYHCFTYLAQRSYIIDSLKPYHWYKQLIVLGARYLRLPDPYLASIESVASIDDPDVGRGRENEALIDRIINYR